MIHVPCDVVKLNAQCMLEGRCAKSFPKKFKDSIVFCKNRFVYCKRRECHDNFVLNDEIIFCNDYIVLYNKELLMRYNAHTYIEICCQSILIKYLFKYVNKRPDRCCMVLQNESNGEIQAYLNCRFIFLYEAFWRLFKFLIHSINPLVERLHVNLPFQQNIVFSSSESLHYVFRRPSINITMLTEWFEWNKKHLMHKNLAIQNFQVSMYGMQAKKNGLWDQGGLTLDV
jgi:hypothetical protein